MRERHPLCFLDESFSLTVDFLLIGGLTQVYVDIIGTQNTDRVVMIFEAKTKIF